jgi:hypothetical protein
MENNAFIVFDNDREGLLFDDSAHKTYPIRVYNVINGKGAEIKKDKSYFGYCYKGIVCMSFDDKPSYPIPDGMYFNSMGNFKIGNIASDENKVLLIEVDHDKGFYQENKFKSLFSIGGPLETHGRLKYIDGCTDSLLIPPVKMGDPCFNHLHFPTDIVQTQHTHPSHRIGMVTGGSGKCITPFGHLPLKKGMIFLIKEWNGESFGEGIDGQKYPVGQHAFETYQEAMDVVAFHPDSDFGATDETHPMINRTIVNGVSASKIDSIRTKDVRS